MSAVVEAVVSVAFVTHERCSPPPPPWSSPTEERHVCMIESGTRVENWKDGMKGKGVRKSGGRLLPSPTQRGGSEISLSASGCLADSAG